MKTQWLAVLWCASVTVLAAGEAAWPPKGTPVRAPVVRDTWVSSVGGETDGNNGSAPRLKTKSIQEFAIVDIDPAPLKGRVVTGAVLHFHCESKDPQRRLTVSTLASEWVEGTATGYRTQKGSTSFDWAATGERPWAYPGSDMAAVMNGMGHTIWRFAESTPPDKAGWQEVAVEPAVVAARAAGLSHGFVVFDDVGSEYTRNGDQFTYHQFPNRFIASREAGAKAAPYFVITLGEADAEAPEAVGAIAGDPAGLPAGEAMVTWDTPADKGPAGTLGFFVRVAEAEPFDWDKATPVPRYLIPMAGGKVRMHLRDLGLKPGATVTLGIRAVDAAGNAGPLATGKVRVSDQPLVAKIPDLPAMPAAEAAANPTLGAVEVYVVDPLDKVQPVTGKMIPDRPAAYRQANHLWSAARKLVSLHAARNEFVAFQIVLAGEGKGITAELAFADAGIRTELLRFRHVQTKDGPLPDPLLPLAGPIDIPAGDEKIAGQKLATLLADVYVPHDAAPGRHKGTLTLKAGGASLPIAVELDTWDFTLPDALSFVPEMNCYGLPDPPQEVAYYRLAHAHRTCLNRLPYHWSGGVSAGCAPKWDGKAFDWADYDRRFGPLFDGTAFKDLPRSGVPVDAFYLPLNENWPLDIHQAFLGGYWIEDAFAPGYRKDFVEVCRQLARHFREKGWTQTLVEFYLNNKVYYKKDGWNRSAAPWIFDEPVNTQDFWAIRWYGIAFHEGVAPERGDARLVYRGDISRPQWQRDLFDGILDVNVVGGTFRKYERMVLDRKLANSEITLNYGGSNDVAASNVQPAAWCVDAWCRGADGVLPWQTVGNDGSWDKADALSLFYPGGPAGQQGPVPSVRLKAYREGQQIVEYLVLLSQAMKQPRWAVGNRVAEMLRLVPSFEQKGAEDAGVIGYGSLDPVDLWRLRLQVGALLDQAKPAPKRKLADLNPPARDVSKLPDLGYATVAPPHLSKAAEEAALKTAGGKSLVIQGKPRVRDAVIQFDAPDRNFGSAPRDNRIARQEQCNAFLLAFDLSDLPKGAQVKKAELSLYVWDPSSKGKSHVCASPITSGDWDEATVTWRQQAAGRPWKGGDFKFGADTAADPAAETEIPPDQGADTAEPPLEYTFDLTKLVQGWASGQVPNHGLAVASVIDRAVDEGNWTRFQVLASEYNRAQFTPKLAITYAAP